MIVLPLLLVVTKLILMLTMWGLTATLSLFLLHIQPLLSLPLIQWHYLNFSWHSKRCSILHAPIILFRTVLFSGLIDLKMQWNHREQGARQIGSADNQVQCIINSINSMQGPSTGSINQNITDRSIDAVLRHVQSIWSRRIWEWRQETDRVIGHWNLWQFKEATTIKMW